MLAGVGMPLLASESRDLPETGDLHCQKHVGLVSSVGKALFGTEFLANRVLGLLGVRSTRDPVDFEGALCDPEAAELAKAAVRR